ncbi:hypothetical protein VE01_07335 [Pseudogymnoascus verrucosus]|uniref:pH-response regulator protein palC n=1 Tax=Pseudogymnoascus verrucosus TaxID=342668 RepID=A0A1B8GGW5_9PEZI|nr:uncharacterized protein VE01_07335 [Pseudogymnoascus verrucosus]OBT95064.1 hypothetical protein VE01_07335 [Pseudogymnoascus verrucosus]
MPYPFTLPTTSPLRLPSHFDSPTHPSLPQHTSTLRAPLRSSLKHHKRLPPPQRASHLPSLLNTLEAYYPALLALDAGLTPSPSLDVVLTSTPRFSWRPTLTSSLPGTKRLELSSLEYEVFFTLATLSYLHTLLARTALHPLYTTTAASPTPKVRTTLITKATKHLLQSAQIHLYLAQRADTLRTTSPLTPPALDISPPTLRALSSLAHAEATLLAVLKDDPYPAALAQERNENDKEWMIRAPSIPKVRAHLFARLCLAGAAHAETASSLLAGNEATEGKLLGRVGAGKVDEGLVRYVDDLRRVGRARACRFLGIDRDLDGKTGEAIAWLRAGMAELGLSPPSSSSDDASGGKKRSGLGLSRLKSSISSKREEKRVEKSGDWGADAGKAEEARVLAALETKWVRENDTVNSQHIPDPGALTGEMPSGREIYTVKAWEPVVLGGEELRRLRGPPGGEGGGEGEGGSSDSEEEGGSGGREADRVVVGAFPGSGGYY